MTEKGQFGLAKPGCQLEDQVFTFYSGQALYTLRPASFTEVGEGYLESPLVDFFGTAFAPRLTSLQQQEEARIGKDKIFTMR